MCCRSMKANQVGSETCLQVWMDVTNMWFSGSLWGIWISNWKSRFIRIFENLIKRRSLNFKIKFLHFRENWIFQKFTPRFQGIKKTNRRLNFQTRKTKWSYMYWAQSSPHFKVSLSKESIFKPSPKLKNKNKHQHLVLIESAIIKFKLDETKSFPFTQHFRSSNMSICFPLSNPYIN